jgi:hypothetical protein
VGQLEYTTFEEFSAHLPISMVFLSGGGQAVWAHTNNNAASGLLAVCTDIRRS